MIRSPMRIKFRLREWRACKMADHPMHYIFNIKRALYYNFFIKMTLYLMGIYKKGIDNALQIKLTKINLNFKKLPSSFDNYRIVFISDIHIDGLEGLAERIKKLINNLPIDIVIFGGDFRMKLSGPFFKALSQLICLTQNITVKDGIYAVLGNHDCIEMIKPLEEKGFKFLVNDSCKILRGEDNIWLIGVDEPHYYKAHNIPLAFQNIPSFDFKIFISHSPEIYKEVSEYNPQIYLCGHTHAGQIQIPFVGPLFTHSKCPRDICYGKWEYNDMIGYTTSGAGASGIPVRFGCQGEVVYITLKKNN